MDEITVLSKDGNYPIIIGEGYLEVLPDLVRDRYDKILLVVDQNVFYIHRKILSKLKTNLHAEVYILPSGEKSKSLSTINSLLSLLTSAKYTRRSLIIAVGGGVTGDVSGFAASIYMRGINIFHVPTTLLSCVDSSVGGKTGINYKGIKNLVGSFYSPGYVVVDPLFLRTLPEDEFKSGMGEVVKYVFLSGGDFYKYADSLKEITKYDIQDLSKMIYTCLLFKTSVTAKDEKDKGLRQLLNFGHTFGHAYESASHFKIKHGFAVAYGIISSLWLSRILDIIPQQSFNEYVRVPQFFIKDKKLRLKEKEIIYYMNLDKKKSGNKIGFVLLKEPGEFLLNIKAGKKEISSSIKKVLL